MNNRQLKAWVNGPRTRDELDTAQVGLGLASIGGETDAALRIRLNAHLGGLPQNAPAGWAPRIGWLEKVITTFAAVQIASDLIWGVSLPIPFEDKRTVIMAMILVTMLGSLAITCYGFYQQTSPTVSRRRVKTFIFFGFLGFFFEGIALFLNARAPIDDGVIIAYTAVILLVSFTADLVASIQVLKN